MLPIYISVIDEPAKRSLFEQVYLRYRKQMFYLARTLLEDTAAAEDAVHDVFLRIASHHMPTLQKLTDPDDLRNYLLKATKNTCINHRKKHWGKTISLDTINEHDLSGDPQLSDDAFWERLFVISDAKQLIHAIRQLPEPYPHILYDHFVLGLSSRELSDFTGVKPATIEKQIYRGKQRLLKLLDQTGGSHDEN